MKSILVKIYMVTVKTIGRKQFINQTSVVLVYKYQQLNSIKSHLEQQQHHLENKKDNIIEILQVS